MKNNLLSIAIAVNLLLCSQTIQAKDFDGKDDGQQTKLDQIELFKKFVGMLTILPDSSGYCEEKSFQIILGRCNDLVISGHACTILTCYFFLSPYIKSSILSIYVVLNLILIVLSRNHYTIDVIFSFFVTNFIFEKWTPVSVLQKPRPVDHFYNH